MDLTFQPVTYSDIGKMMPYYFLRPNQTCDSVFLETILWRKYYNVQYAIWEGRALLWLAELDGKKFSAMPMCKPEDLPEAFGAIERYFNENLGLPLVINLADQFAVDLLNLPRDRYLVEEQVDSRDYLYDGNALRTLSGKKLHKKKNRLNAFMRAYEGRYEYRRLDCADDEAVWNFQEKWRELRGEDEEHLDFESAGIRDILNNCYLMAGAMGGVFIDGKLEAFTIGSLNPMEQMAVIHIEKANPEIDGLYQYINQQFLLDAFPEVPLVNREDDMGLEGLRQSKMGYNPVGFAHKYLVQQLKDGSKGYNWAEHIENTASGISYDYLTGEDRLETRRLYESCFPEDSASFTDYYYGERTANSRIAVRKDSGLIVSMAHLNPYEVKLGESRQTLDYLVAVGTEEGRRRQGHYQDMFRKILGDQHEEGKPFTYLVPVNPEVYRPLGFAMMGRAPESRLAAGMADQVTVRRLRDEDEDLRVIARLLDGWMDEAYEVHTVRSRAWLVQMIHELESDGGQMQCLMRDGEIVAVRGLDDASGKQRFLYGIPGVVENTGWRPWNMGRITSLQHFLELFRLEKSGRLELTVDFADPVITDNAGRYRWTLTESGSSAEKLLSAGPAAEDAEVNVGDADLTADSAALLTWLMGICFPEKAMPALSGQVLDKCRQIHVMQGVLLDEVV